MNPVNTFNLFQFSCATFDIICNLLKAVSIWQKQKQKTPRINGHAQYIYNIRTLSVNIKFICTSFRNRQNSELFRPVSQRVQMNFIFNDNVRILCLSCKVKKVGKLVRFKQKGQKQASFLAFHKCCHGCLLRGPRYISTSFILVCALRCTQLQGTRKVYSQAEKFIRIVRKVYSSITNKAKIYSYSIFVQQMY